MKAERCESTIGTTSFDVLHSLVLLQREAHQQRIVDFCWIWRSRVAVQKITLSFVRYDA